MTLHRSTLDRPHSTANDSSIASEATTWTFHPNGIRFTIASLNPYNHQYSCGYGQSEGGGRGEGDVLSGTVGEDVLSIGGGVIEIPDQSFGEVVKEQGGLKSALANNQFDGVLGLGFDPHSATGRPFLLNLVDQDVLQHAVFGVYLGHDDEDGEEDEEGGGSQLTLGGLDPSHRLVDIQWHEVTRQSQGQWAIELTAFALRREAFEIDGNAVIDSGFPYIALTRYQAEMINLQIGAKETSPGRMDFSKESGVIAVFGQVFLRKYYSAYDLESHRIGFALAS
ncbi:Vacuolar protease A [Mortierella sp. 14UC]|nr:Vacuolar protease A [Mortierella sp. 14UC]